MDTYKQLEEIYKQTKDLLSQYNKMLKDVESIEGSENDSHCQHTIHRLHILTEPLDSALHEIENLRKYLAYSVDFYYKEAMLRSIKSELSLEDLRVLEDSLFWKGDCNRLYQKYFNK